MLYYDRAYMGAGNYGVAAAAEYVRQAGDRHFAGETAMLSGLFKAPKQVLADGRSGGGARPGPASNMVVPGS